MRSNTARSNQTRSSLLTASTMCRMPNSEQISECRLIWASTPMRASTSSTARSAVEALVAHDELGIVEQAANQRRFAVVDRATGEKPQQALVGHRRHSDPAIGHQK